MTTYVVQRGDTLFAIAARFGTSVAALVALNRISNLDVLVVGQVLVIPTPVVALPRLTYTVRPGDTLFRIAQLFGVTIQAIAQANALVDPNLIFVGQVLIIPGYTFTSYTVVPGDTLTRISAGFGVPIAQIVAVNAIVGPNLIFVGQGLVIPRPTAALPPPVRPLIETLGYLTMISETRTRAILSELNPFITYTAIFDFPVDGAGGITVAPGFRPALRVSREFGPAPLAVFTNWRGANFDPDLARAAMTGEARTATVGAMIDFSQREGFAGINIDFENMYPEDRPLYTEFIRELFQRTRGTGLSLSNAMAPKWADWPTLPWVGAFDYQALAPFLDFTVLMTYEWGWAGGPPGPVAPVNLVRRVLDYAVRHIPREKILMGIPLYGYDWPVPLPAGTLARPVSPQDAIALAARYGVDIAFDPVAQAPWFRYIDEAGTVHEVWFSDARTSQAQHALIAEYGLRGAGYWNLLYDFPQNWLMLADRFTVRRMPISPAS